MIATLSVKRQYQQDSCHINATEAAQVWNDIEAGHGLVAIDREWAAAQHLPPTVEHPRHASKVFYTFEAYHHIHCVVSPLTTDAKSSFQDSHEG